VVGKGIVGKKVDRKLMVEFQLM